MDLTTSIAYLIVGICSIISGIHYLIIKSVYKFKGLDFKFTFLGMILGIFIAFLANIFFRIPELIIYAFEEEENIFAAFITIVFSIISCFALSFFTYYIFSFSYKFIPSEIFFEDYNGFVISIGFYPMYFLIYYFLDLVYFYSHYENKYLIFTSKQDEIEKAISNTEMISYLINIISVPICLYIGNICTWFYMIQRDIKTFIKCILFPSLITTIPFFSFILYSIRVNFIITSLLGAIGIGLSIVWRIRVFKEYHKQPFIITISEEEKDDLVEYIDDRICIENFNKEPNLRIPISFSGINFGYK